MSWLGGCHGNVGSVWTIEGGQIMASEEWVWMELESHVFQLIKVFSWRCWSFFQRGETNQNKKHLIMFYLCLSILNKWGVFYICANKKNKTKKHKRTKNPPPHTHFLCPQWRLCEDGCFGVFSKITIASSTDQQQILGCKYKFPINTANQKCCQQLGASSHFQKRTCFCMCTNWLWKRYDRQTV